MLLANLMLICAMSVADVPLLLSCLHDSSAIAANIEQVIFSVVCFLVYFAR